MLATTEGIVLHFIKYSESSVVATVYTRDFGRQSYIINSARSKKAKNKVAFLQPLFLVELTAYQKHLRELNRIKEIKISNSYQNIPFDIFKSTQAIFLAEILYKVLKEQESYPEMFDFIKNSLLYFDLTDSGFAGFYLFFLFRLTEYLGFLPDTGNSGSEVWFDYKKGAMVSAQPVHPFYANKYVSKELIKLSKIKIHELPGFNVARPLRNEMLEALLDYYRIHFDSVLKIKSLAVLREVFGG